MSGRARVAAVALLLSAAGCGGSPAADPLAGVDPGSTGSVSTSDTGSAPTVSAPAEVTRAVSDGYLAYWQALIRAHAAGNPRDPQLAAHARGAALAVAVGSISDNIRAGVRLRGTVSHQPKISVTGPTTATVQDCVDLSRWVALNAKTGRPDRSVSGLRKVRADYTLVLAGGTWKVDTVTERTAC